MAAAHGRRPPWESDSLTTGSVARYALIRLIACQAMTRRRVNGRGDKVEGFVSGIYRLGGHAMKRSNWLVLAALGDYVLLRIGHRRGVQR